MLKLIIKQANWGVLGSIFAFLIGFFVKIYLIDIVGLASWGRYIAAQNFASAIDTFLAIGIPFVILKFIPDIFDKDKRKAERIASLFFRYGLFIGLLFFVMMYFLAPFFDLFIYKKLNDFSWILFLMCAHIPISLSLAVITSLYRSILKIKEIVIYGTIVTVSFRAFLTFVIFRFTDDISYFIFIELFTQLIGLSLLFYLFNKNEFSIVSKFSLTEVLHDKKIVSYGKKLFLHSIIAFISGHSLSVIISIIMPPASVGAYNILLTLTGLTTFLLINLNKVFAPAISKLYANGEIKELNNLYKQTTFIINLLTIPLAVIITIFADEILMLYRQELVMFKPYLYIMLVGGMVSLAAGSSGTIMVMAGLERENLLLQSIRAILLIVLSIWLIPIKQMYAVVILYVLFMLFVNISQLIYLSKRININPFSKPLLTLFFITIPFMLFAINIDYSYELYHFILLPLIIYFIYFSFLYTLFKGFINDIL